MNADDFELEVVGDFYVSERAVQLPASVAEDQARARYDAGVLTVRLPKVEARRRSRISIESG